MEAGAAAADICEVLYENVTLESLASNALFLEKYQLYLDGKILFLPITMADKERYGFTDENIEGYAALSRKIAGGGAGHPDAGKGSGRLQSVYAQSQDR